MFSLHTFASLAAQMARLVPAPSKHADRRTRTGGDAGDGCGLCPHCREFVFLRYPGDDGPAACPRCGRPVDELEPLGPR